LGRVTERWWVAVQTATKKWMETGGVRPAEGGRKDIKDVFGETEIGCANSDGGRKAEADD